MKRAYGALFATLIIFLLVGISQRYMLTVSNRLISGLDCCTQLYQVEEYGAAEGILTQLYNYYQKNLPYLNLLVRKEYLLEIAENLKGLSAFCNAESPQDYIHSLQGLQEEINAVQKLFFSWL